MDYLGESKKCADLAIYQSVLTRDCRPYGEGSAQVNLMTAANFSGLVTDMVLEEDSVEILSRYPMERCCSLEIAEPIPIRLQSVCPMRWQMPLV